MKSVSVLILKESITYTTTMCIYGDISQKACKTSNGTVAQFDNKYESKKQI